jgi:hypothetical protein
VKVSGFTFVRNAIKYDYPVVESITSILPLCDEFIVSVGRSEDATLELIRSIPSDKIRIVESVWDDSLRTGGRVLAVETDKAFAQVAADADWAFYLQADEVVHEQYLPVIREAMERYQAQPEVEGLLLRYLHFYGTYRYVGDSRNWYRREIRVIRNDARIRSYRDAQGFRKEDQKLQVKLIDASIYHYGWVKNPFHQKAKEKTFYKLWHPDNPALEAAPAEELFDYTNIDSLQLFQGSHPQVMHDRIARMDWEFTFAPGKRKTSLKNQLLNWIEKRTGKRLFEYRNYRLLR